MSTELNPLFNGGIKKHFGLKYDLYKSKIPVIFHVEDTNSRFVDHQGWTKHGLPARRGVLEPIAERNFEPDYGKRYTIVNYAMKDFIAEEDWADDQYGVLSRLLPMKGGAFADSFRVLEETVAANMFKNYAFATGSSVSGSPDGYSLFNTAHPAAATNTGTTWSNRPSTDADLSIATYQAGANNLRDQYASNQVEIIDNEPRLLVCHTDQGYIAKQILRGEWERGTADRNVNTIRDDNVQLCLWPYFRISGSTGTRNAWMLIGKNHHLYFIRRQKPQFKTDYDINSLAYVFVGWNRFTVGWSNARGTYGSKGA